MKTLSKPSVCQFCELTAKEIYTHGRDAGAQAVMDEAQALAECLKRQYKNGFSGDDTAHDAELDALLSRWQAFVKKGGQE